MKEPLWLNKEDCLALHDMLLAQYGGLSGLRDERLLESALAKPRNLFAYRSSALAKMAASYAAGIIHNHPFLDGNKRTGFMLAATFIELNGLSFTATEESVIEKTVALANGELDEAGYAAWLAGNSNVI